MGADAPSLPGRNKSASAQPPDFDGQTHSYLADLNEQTQDRCQLIIKQMAAAEGVTEDLKRRSQWEWIKAMNSIVNRAAEIIKSEIINA